MNHDSEYVHCEICGSLEYSNFYSDGVWKVVKCRNCGQFFVNPRPLLQHLSNYYTDEYFNRCVIYNPDQDLTVKEFYPILEKIEKKTKKIGTLLDLGCGRGYFLAAAQSRGWNVIGIDISNDAVTFARDTFNVNAIQADPVSWETDMVFDFVVAFHTIEHLPHPLQVLQRIRTFMKSGAGLLVRVPNIKSTDRIWHGKNWYAWQLPVHLWHFDPGTMRKLLMKAGFVNVRVETRLFNPFDHIAYGIQLGELRKDASSYYLKSRRNMNTFVKALFLISKAFSFFGNRFRIKSFLSDRNMEVWATTP